jgi:DNA-binding winged helix-turn-helix (wHTH) protein
MKNDEVAFGPYRLDRPNALLWRGVERVQIMPKPFDVLSYLVDHPGKLVTKDELMSAVWGSLHVSESSLTVAINALRTALGDDRTAPLYIETVTRRGYRFVATVKSTITLLTVPSGVLISTSEENVAQLKNAWVGRTHSLNVIDRAIRAARSGQRQVVFVTGEAGIGKTTLIQMALRLVDAGDVGVLQCQCNELFGAHEAFLPLLGGLHDLCRDSPDDRLFDLLRTRAPAWLAQMPWVLGDQERSAIQHEVFGSNRERMLREFCEFIERLAARRLWLIVLEDLHWSDPATVDALSRLARRENPARLLILATYRSTEVSVLQHPITNTHRDLQVLRRCVEADLGGLNRTEVEEHLALRFESVAVASALADGAFSRTEGQPLFVVALVDHLVSEGAVARIENEWRLVEANPWTRESLPRDIREMIQRKIQSLSANERALLDLASAAGPTFSALLLAGAMGYDILEIEAVCEQLVRSTGLLRTAGVSEWPDGGVSGEYTFIHALYQQVLYEQLSPARRANAHLKLGESLERGFEADLSAASELATHFEQGRDFAKALKYFGLAAEGSARRFNTREAAGYLSRALTVIAPLPSRARAEMRTRLLLRRAWAWRAGGEFGAALEDLKAMVASAAEAGNLREEVSALVNLSRFQLYVDRRQCLDVASHAVALSGLSEDGATKALAEGNLANLHLMLKPWRDSDAQICRRAIDMINDEQDLSARARRCSMEMTLAFLSSDYAACYVATRAGRELAREIGDVYFYVIYNFAESIALLHAGEWGTAADLATSALAIADRNFNTQASALCHFTLAWLYVEAGKFDDALREAEGLLSQSLETNPFSFFIGRIVLTKACLGRNDIEAALRHVEAMARREADGVMMETAIVPHYILAKYHCYFYSGALNDALGEAKRLYEWASAAPDRQFLAFALEARAKVERARGEHSAACAHLAEAIRLVRRRQFPLAARRIYGTAADVFEGRGQKYSEQALRSREAEVTRSLERSLTRNRYSSQEHMLT